VLVSGEPPKMLVRSVCSQIRNARLVGRCLSTASTNFACTEASPVSPSPANAPYIAFADKITLALITYKRLNHANLLPPGEKFAVPQKFTVPTGSPEWPSVTWGLELGKIARNINFEQSSYAQYKEHSQKLGLVPNSAMRAWTVILALKIYRQVYGIREGEALQITREFVVPSDSPDWPQCLWGIKLGNSVFGVRYKGLFSAYHEELKNLGVHVREPPWFAQQLLLAVETYKKLHRINQDEPVAIPPTFVVPKQDSRWGDQLGGLQLGKKVQAMFKEDLYARYKAAFELLRLRPWTPEDEAALQAKEQAEQEQEASYDWATICRKLAEEASKADK
jgi:hypothetical protein